MTQSPNPGSPKSNKALLIVDMVSDFTFEDGETLFPFADAAATRIDALRRRAAAADVPVVYINDNYGDWRHDFAHQVDAACETELGRSILNKIAPGNDDLYILKPQRSGFFETPLAMLLSSLDATDLIITGVTTDICVLFTAHDAYMRGYKVSVPRDCSAAVDPDHHETAIKLLERVCKADTGPSNEIKF